MLVIKLFEDVLTRTDFEAKIANIMLQLKENVKAGLPTKVTINSLLSVNFNYLLDLDTTHPKNKTLTFDSVPDNVTILEAKKLIAESEELALIRFEAQCSEITIVENLFKELLIEAIVNESGLSESKAVKVYNHVVDICENDYTDMIIKTFDLVSFLSYMDS